MPFVSPGHIWLILLLLIVVLIIWGPGKLPDVGAGMGRAIREFKKATNEVRDSVVNASPTDSAPSPPTPPTSKPEVTEEPKAPV